SRASGRGARQGHIRRGCEERAAARWRSGGAVAGVCGGGGPREREERYFGAKAIWPRPSTTRTPLPFESVRAPGGRLPRTTRGITCLMLAELPNMAAMASFLMVTC